MDTIRRGWSNLATIVHHGAYERTLKKSRVKTGPESKPMPTVGANLNFVFETYLGGKSRHLHQIRCVYTK